MKEKSKAVLCLDQIEAGVYGELKKQGFRKSGRTLHRFVSGDISQVVNFQCGQSYRDETHLMWVNLGIRVPECCEESFFPAGPLKKCYQEYECNIRSRLGSIDQSAERCFDLNEGPEKILPDILRDLTEKVLPVFDLLSSREAILAHRREYPSFDILRRHLVLLDEAMIYGHLGELEKAKERFDTYYRGALETFLDQETNGRQVYLQKGQRLVTGRQDITAEKDGYVTVYGGNRGHMEYLDRLAAKLGFRKG
jgi:hypothetical protein